MSNLFVKFQLPSYIESGLISGSMERVGGVIRLSDNKQIVAWLREGTDLSQADSSILQSLHLTPQLLTSFMGAGMVLNMGLSAATLLTTIQRFDQLTQDIENLKAEFKRDRDNSFHTALQIAQEASENVDNEVRKALLIQAASKIQEGRNQFIRDFKEAVQERNLSAAMQYLVRAQYASLSRVQCFLELDELGSALQKLTRDVGEFRNLAKEAVITILGPHPAIFLHPTSSDQNVERFFVIQRWLHGFSSYDVSKDMQILHELRKDFWNQQLQDDGNILLQITSGITQLTTGKPLRRFTDNLNELPNVLAQAELAIENYSRLESFQLELKYVQLEGKRFEQWRNLISGEEIQRKGNGLGLILLDEPVSLEDVA